MLLVIFSSTGALVFSWVAQFSKHEEVLIEAYISIIERILAMSILGVIVEEMRYHVGLNTIICGFLILVIPTTVVIRNLYYHPLSRFPGPKLWAVSRLPYIHALLNATLVKRTQQFHNMHGEIVRIAPDELSFASEEAWHDIYAHRRGHKRAPRDKTLFVCEQIRIIH